MHNLNSSNHRRNNEHNTNSAISDTSSTSFHQRFDFSQLKARLPELNCLHNLQRYWQTEVAGVSSGNPSDKPSGVGVSRDEGGSYYANNILGYTFGYNFGKDQNKADTSKETPLQKFYRHQQQKKMPAFRGRRGWCGCFQASSWKIFSNNFGSFNQRSVWGKFHKSVNWKTSLFLVVYSVG